MKMSKICKSAFFESILTFLLHILTTKTLVQNFLQIGQISKTCYNEYVNIQSAWNHLNSNEVGNVEEKVLVEQRNNDQILCYKFELFN
jgi:hypothetical protein